MIRKSSVDAIPLPGAVYNVRLAPTTDNPNGDPTPCVVVSSVRFHRRWRDHYRWIVPLKQGVPHLPDLTCFPASHFEERVGEMGEEDRDALRAALREILTPGPDEAEVPNPGECFMVDVAPGGKFPMGAHVPCMVVSNAKFNRDTGGDPLWVIPIMDNEMQFYKVSAAPLGRIGDYAGTESRWVTRIVLWRMRAILR